MRRVSSEVSDRGRGRGRRRLGLVLLGLLDDQGLGRSSMPAIEAALRSAERVTLTGSMTPALIRSPYSPVAALKPLPTPSSRTLETTT